MKKTVHTKKATHLLMEKGIISMTVNENERLELEDAKESHRVNLELSEGGKFCVLLNAKKFFLPSSEAQQFIAGKECTRHRLASAFIVNSLSMRLLGNYYIRFFSNSTPSRFFKNEREALPWLRSFLDK